MYAIPPIFAGNICVFTAFKSSTLNVFKGIFYCRYALHILCAGALDAANKWTTNKWTAAVLPIQNGWGDRRKGFN